MLPTQRQFIVQAQIAAEKAGHPFSLMAACEASEESGYGTSILARSHNNLFGMKQHAHAIYGTVNLPTREYLKSQWVMVLAKFIHYPDWASCFADRKATLERLSNVLPHYKAAIEAVSPEDYIREVSKTWSTDPTRGEKVLAIYQAFQANPTA